MPLIWITQSLLAESSPIEQRETWLEKFCYFNTAHYSNAVKTLGNRCYHLYSNKCFRGHKIAEVGRKKNSLMRGTYNPGPEPISCPTWGFAHDKWFIDLGLIMQYSSLRCEYLPKNAKNKQTLLFLLAMKHFRIIKCYSHEAPAGGKQAPAQVTGFLTKAAPDKWAGCSFRAVQAPEKSLRPDLLVSALYLLSGFGCPCTNYRGHFLQQPKAGNSVCLTFVYRDPQHSVYSGSSEKELHETWLPWPISSQSCFFFVEAAKIFLFITRLSLTLSNSRQVLTF